MEACRRCVFSSRAVAGVAIAPTADRVLPLIGWNRHAPNCTGPRSNASRGLTGLQAHRRQVRLSVAPRRRGPASHYAAVSFCSGGSPRDAACRQAGQLISNQGNKPGHTPAPGFSALLTPLGALAWQAKKIWRVGFVVIGARPALIESRALGGFALGMREAGHLEGRDRLI